MEECGLRHPRRFFASCDYQVCYVRRTDECSWPSRLYPDASTCAVKKRENQEYTIQGLRFLALQKSAFGAIPIQSAGQPGCVYRLLRRRNMHRSGSLQQRHDCIVDVYLTAARANCTAFTYLNDNPHLNHPHIHCLVDEFVARKQMIFRASILLSASIRRRRRTITRSFMQLPTLIGGVPFHRDLGCLQDPLKDGHDYP